MLYTTLEHTRFYQEAMEEGRKEQAVDSVFRLLKKRFRQEVSEEMRAQISGLPLSTLRKLTEDLLDFNSLADLQPWLESQ